MILHLYTMCYNEMDILPFVVDYWKELGVSKAIVFDNGSTDGSVEFMQKYDWIDVRYYYSMGCNDVILRRFKNECWKESRGKADFVIVCDIDECLISPFGMDTFDKMKDGGYTICKPKWYEFISEEIPIYTEGKFLHEISEKAFLNESGKTVLFNPNEIKEINYGFGAHQCEPIGNVSYYNNGLYLLHISKRLSLEYMIKKYKEAKDRYSFVNRINSYGFHYSASREKLTSDYENGLKESINFNKLISYLKNYDKNSIMLYWKTRE